MNLPAPRQKYEKPNLGVKSSSAIQPSSSVHAPPYGSRQRFVPKQEIDYGDGGSFPEINMTQYPLNMGKPGAKSSAVVGIVVDGKGNVKYDSIVQRSDGGNNSNGGGKMTIHSALSDTYEKSGDQQALTLPNSDEVADTAERTRLALEAKMTGKIRGPGKSNAHQLQLAKKDDKEPQYIRYNVNPDAPGYTATTAQRVVKMVEAPVDPMEPPKHKLVKATKVRSDSPPAPIMHAPAQKLTKEQQEAWKIPPAISNWKNENGYIIPLDKRLAADGRGIHETTINDKFASLSEALYMSEKKAADDLRARNNVRKQMALKEKEDKEEELRALAAKARASRAETLNREIDGYGAMGASDDDGDGAGAAQAPPRPSASSSSSNPRGVSNKPAWMTQQENETKDAPEPAPMPVAAAVAGTAATDDGGESDDTEDEGERIERLRKMDNGGSSNADAAEKMAQAQRERLRAERRKERERELRQENMKGKGKNGARGDGERDISEKIALGIHTGKGGAGGEAMYDARLFNQSSGMDAGFGAEDEYNAYSKPLFNQDGAASSIYRPRQAAEDAFGNADAQMTQLKSSTSKFKADKGFEGAEGGGAAASSNSSGPRNAPVQFEKAREHIGGGMHDDDDNNNKDTKDGAAPKRARRE
jgi:SNW domain-containing protein 1